MLAAEGPLVARTGQHTGRSPNDKFVVREPSSEKHVHWGAVNRPIDAEKFDALHRDMMAYLQDKELYVLDAWAGADPNYRLPIRVVNEFAWHNLFARNMFLPEHDADQRARASSGVHGHRRAELQGRPGAPRHALRRVHPRALRQEAGADRRHALRRRDQEVDLHDPQLHAAAAGRDVDALLGEHRRGRRHGALLRPLRHRQDDAVERPAPPADWRRRARLERHRRLQLRGRLLRQGDQAVGRSRAADLRDDAALRHHSRERGRSTRRRARSISTTRRYTENTRGSYPIDFIDNAELSGRGGHPTNVIMLTADAYGVLPPIARLTRGRRDVSLPLRLHRARRRHREGRDRAEGGVQHLLRRAVPAAQSERLRADARREDRQARRGASGW